MFSAAAAAWDYWVVADAYWLCVGGVRCVVERVDRID